jgi:hypothetical protein
MFSSPIIFQKYVFVFFTPSSCHYFVNGVTGVSPVTYFNFNNK